MSYEQKPDTRLVALLLMVMVIVPALITAELAVPRFQPKFGSAGGQPGGGAGSGGGVGGGGPAAGPAFKVLMPDGVGLDKSLNFQPKSLTLIVGKNNTLVWVNQDITDHTVTFTVVPSGVTASSISISDVAPGDTSPPLSLTVPGTYAYHCQFHPSWMRGTIVVKGG